MRHLWSLLAGVVAAPLAWLGLATGQYGSERLVARWQDSGRFDTADLIGPVLFLLAVGVLLGLVGTLRWSPAGPLAAGLLLIAPTVFMFVNPFETLDAFSYGETTRWLSQDFQLWQPVQNGTLLVLGALLLMAVLSAQRWRRWPEQPEPIRPAADDEVVAGTAALTEPAGAGSISDDEIAAGAATDEQAAAADQPGEPGDSSGEPAESAPGTKERAPLADNGSAEPEQAAVEESRSSGSGASAS